MDSPAGRSAARVVSTRSRASGPRVRPRPARLRDADRGPSAPARGRRSGRGAPRPGPSPRRASAPPLAAADARRGSASRAASAKPLGVSCRPSRWVNEPLADHSARSPAPGGPSESPPL